MIQTTAKANDLTHSTL